MIDNLKTRNITLTLTLFRSSVVFKNVGIFVPKEMLINTLKISTFKLSAMFSPKDFVPDSLKSRVVYQFYMCEL